MKNDDFSFKCALLFSFRWIKTFIQQLLSSSIAPSAYEDNFSIEREMENVSPGQSLDKRNYLNIDSIVLNWTEISAQWLVDYEIRTSNENERRRRFFQFNHHHEWWLQLSSIVYVRYFLLIDLWIVDFILLVHTRYSESEYLTKCWTPVNDYLIELLRSSLDHFPSRCSQAIYW